MLEPMIEIFNCFDVPIMVCRTVARNEGMVEEIVAPGDSLIVFDERMKVTSMVRKLTAKEMEDWLAWREEIRLKQEEIDKKAAAAREFLVG